MASSNRHVEVSTVSHYYLLLVLQSSDKTVNCHNGAVPSKQFLEPCFHILENNMTASTTILQMNQFHRTWKLFMIISTSGTRSASVLFSIYYSVVPVSTASTN